MACATSLEVDRARHRSMVTTLLCLSVLAQLIAAAAPAQAVQPEPDAVRERLNHGIFEALRSAGGEIPPAFAGIWQLHFDFYDCSTNEFLFSGAETETTCAGDDFYDEKYCTGTVTDSSFHIECSEEEVNPGCTAVSTEVSDGTVSGDSMVVTGMISRIENPSDCFIGSYCWRVESIGVRIAPEPPDCATPVEATSWGEVKAMYR